MSNGVSASHPLLIMRIIFNIFLLQIEHLDPLVNQLCRVCDEPAAGFHFGAFTCEGCKSFFGRTCNNQSVIAECKNNYRCVVDKKNRTSCKACRLRKCLMVGMSKSGSRYGRRSNWFKIHCLMQANSNKRPAAASLPPPVSSHHHQPPASAVQTSLHNHENQLPPTMQWPPRLGLPTPLHVPPHPGKTVSAFESYANLLKHAEAAKHDINKKSEDLDPEESDHISVSRSPSPPAAVSSSPLNISSISDTSSKSSHSILSSDQDTLSKNILDMNKNSSALTSAQPHHPLFPFGLSPGAGAGLSASLSHLYNPLSFASPLYRLRQVFTSINSLSQSFINHILTLCDTQLCFIMIYL